MQKNVKAQDGSSNRVTFRGCASSKESMSALSARTTLTKRRDLRAAVQPAQRGNDVTAPTSIRNVQPRTPTILVVDNDPLTMHLAAAVLHRAGYDILRATSGAHALSIAYKPAVHVDLIVTAVTMPHMSGTYLADLLLARDPQLRVLFLTSTEETKTTRTSAQQRGPTFQKPFTTDGLLEVIAMTLGKPLTRAAT
ncbi:MAG: sensor hybrid histidine kinase [Bryobacterales bacterium]|nr:sensor hybrid histidine kinase [Bryobacterales bacterium]